MAKDYKFEKRGNSNIIVIDYSEHSKMLKRHKLRKKRNNKK